MGAFNQINGAVFDAPSIEARLNKLDGLGFNQRVGAAQDMSQLARRLDSLDGLNARIQGGIELDVDSLMRRLALLEAGGSVIPAVLGMRIGFNVVSPYYGAATNSVPFANLMWQAERWQYSGGFWANQDQGITSGNPGTQTLYALIANDDVGTLMLPAGVYTFRNPAGNNVAVGSVPGASDYIAWTTSTAQQTFTLTQNATLCVSIKGDATNPSGTRTGGIQIILPGHEASWDAGDYFNSAWVNLHLNAGTQMFRFMDWRATNNSIATDWANQGSVNKITLNTIDVGKPWEVIIAAANKFNKPAHINLSPRVTDAYVTSLGALLASTYTPSQVFMEYGNETWNTFQIFALGYNWVAGLAFTKKTVAVDPVTGLCTLTAHGWANDNRVHPTISHAGRALNWYDEGAEGYYEALWGFPWYVKVISANTFELWTGAGGTGTKMDLSSAPSGNSGITELLMWNEAEAGKTIDNNGNHATRTKQIADILDAALPGKVKVIMGTQSAYADGITQPRLANATVTARVDYLATAPYYNSSVLAGAIDRTSNTFTPKVWGYDDGTMTCSFGVYAQGSTPTIAQVIAGTGTGFVAKSPAIWTHTYNSTAYTSGGAVTVVNGTTYRVFFVVTDSLGCTWMWSQDVAAANVADTVNVLDTDANQLARALYWLDGSGYHNVFATAAQHKAYIAASANPAIKLMAYECNSHENYDFPPAVKTWHEAWMGNAAYGGVMMTHYLSQLSAAQFDYANIFLDINGTGPWGVASSTYDITDGRYLAVAAFNGGVPVHTAIDLGPVTGTRIAAAPGSYPYVAHTFADPTLTYTIRGGNNDARWDVSGGTVRLLNSTGIDYASTASYVLKIQAEGGNVVSNFDLTMATGPAAWNATFLDAQWAFNSVTDTDNTAINPSSGSALPITAGTGASIAGGYWDPLGATAYGGNGLTAVTGNISTTPWLVAVTLNKDNQTGTDVEPFQLGGFPFVTTYIGGDGFLYVRLNDGTNDWYRQAGPWDGANRLYWKFYDGAGKFYFGNNQTDTTAGAGVAATPASVTFNRFVGYAALQSKFGSSVFLMRAGMTRAQALAIVQILQNLPTPAIT